MTTVDAAAKTVPDAAKTAPAVMETAPAVTKTAPATKPERIQDMPPDWLPHIDEECVCSHASRPTNCPLASRT